MPLLPQLRPCLLLPPPLCSTFNRSSLQLTPPLRSLRWLRKSSTSLPAFPPSVGNWGVPEERRKVRLDAAHVTCRHSPQGQSCVLHFMLLLLLLLKATAAAWVAFSTRVVTGLPDVICDGVHCGVHSYEEAFSKALGLADVAMVTWLCCQLDPSILSQVHTRLGLVFVDPTLCSYLCAVRGGKVAFSKLSDNQILYLPSCLETTWMPTFPPFLSGAAHRLMCHTSTRCHGNDRKVWVGTGAGGSQSGRATVAAAAAGQRPCQCSIAGTTRKRQQHMMQFLLACCQWRQQSTLTPR